MINIKFRKQKKNHNILKHNTMKKRIILATIAVAIIAGVSIFAACTKEENKRNVVHSNSKSADATDNPYDFMGQWHNEALTGLYNQYNTLFVSDENAYAYLKQFH